MTRRSSCHLESFVTAGLMAAASRLQSDFHWYIAEYKSRGTNKNLILLPFYCPGSRCRRWGWTWWNPHITTPTHYHLNWLICWLLWVISGMFCLQDRKYWKVLIRLFPAASYCIKKIESSYFPWTWSLTMSVWHRRINRSLIKIKITLEYFLFRWEKQHPRLPEILHRRVVSIVLSTWRQRILCARHNFESKERNVEPPHLSPVWCLIFKGSKNCTFDMQMAALSPRHPFSM